MNSAVISTASSNVRADLRSNKLLQILLGGYIVVWIVLAVSPVNRRDWFLENLLVFVILGVLVVTYRVFPLSQLSYLLITLFLLLHALGAHYTYEHVPFGYWLKAILGLKRNHFDRIVHFSFGLLLSYPVREILLRLVRVRPGWAYPLTFTVVLAFSDFFEVLESWIAQIVSPELGAAYLGTQGDIWDAQKDTTAAGLGSILCLLVIAVVRRLAWEKPTVK